MVNSGISFSIPLPGVAGLSAVLVGILIYLAVKLRSAGLGLIALGGSLNLAERLLFGGVNDYWKIPMLPIYNNFNDILITAGVVIFLWKSWHQK